MQQNVLYTDHNAVRIKTKKPTYIWKLNTTFLNNSWVEENLMKMRKYLDMNKTEGETSCSGHIRIRGTRIRSLPHTKVPDKIYESRIFNTLIPATKKQGSDRNKGSEPLCVPVYCLEKAPWQ